MKNQLWLFTSIMLAIDISQAQTIDTTLCFSLIKSDPTEFIQYTKSAGFKVDTEATTQMLFAKRKGVLYAKPLDNKNDNANYKLQLVISTLNKENSSLILRNAKELDTKNDIHIWVDNEYMYYELSMMNPISNELWYKIMVYKKIINDNKEN